MDIKDKVIIVTGASGGIGLATSKLLAHRGAKVVLAARSKEKLEKLERELPYSFAVVTDMRKHEDIKNLIKKTIEKYGRIDMLINNAGQGMYGLIESIDTEKYKEVMELNVYGALRAMQEVIPHMRKQGGGMIVNVSSGTAKRFIPHIGAYSSTKYALNALSFIARQELAKDKIIVGVISPKMTATKFAENAVGERPKWDPSRPRPEIDSAEKVAENIEKLIVSEKEEIML